MSHHLTRVQISLTAAIALAAIPAAAGPLEGVYTSQLGDVRIVEKDGVVTGKAVTGGGPCKVKKGAVILDGTRLDDSVTGELYACGQGCGKNKSGLVMLLITRGGKALSGAAHFDGKCKTPLKGDAIAFRKGGSSGAKGTRVAQGTGDKDTPPASERPVAGNDSKGPKARGDDGKGRGKGKHARDDGKGKGKGKHARGDDGQGQGQGKGKGKGKHARGDDGKGKGKHARGDDAPRKKDNKLPDVQDEDRPALDGEYSPEARKKAEAKATNAQQLLQQGRAEEARALFEEAVQVDPTYSQGYNGIGVTYYMRDRYDEAKDAYGLALEADPANPDVYYNLACIHALTNETEQAFGYLQIALLNGYVDLSTLSQDPDLKSLAGDPRFEALKRGELP